MSELFSRMGFVSLRVQSGRFVVYEVAEQRVKRPGVLSQSRDGVEILCANSICKRLTRWYLKNWWTIIATPEIIPADIYLLLVLFC